MSSARTHLIRLGAAALASAGILGTASGVAGAATSSGSAGSANSSGNSGSRAVPATLDGIKTKANTDITNRVNDLNAAVAKVNAAKGLGSGQATLVTYLSTDISPLPQLNQKIQGDATVRQAAEDFSTLFTGYRVYVLVLPASRIAADADRATNTAIPKLTADFSKAQGLVNPQNQGQLQPLIDDLNNQISVAMNATNDLAATVLADTPVQWNANSDLLSPSKSAAQTADAALKKGWSDVAQIRQLLMGTAAAGTATSGSKLKGAGLRHLGTTTIS
jgi:hypothetical protein